MNAETTWPPEPIRRDHSRKCRDILESELDLRAALGQPVSRAVLINHLHSQANIGKADARRFVCEYCDRNGILERTPWNSVVMVVLVGLCICCIVLGIAALQIIHISYLSSQAAIRPDVSELGKTLDLLPVIVVGTVSASVVVYGVERTTKRRDRSRAL